MSQNDDIEEINCMDAIKKIQDAQKENKKPAT